MPNNCENDLTLHGSAAAVNRCVLLHTQPDDAPWGGPFPNADSILPYPEPYRTLDAIAHQHELDHPKDPWKDRPKDGYNQGGYEWCTKNWGTKWGGYDYRDAALDDESLHLTMDDDDGTEYVPVTYRVTFDTAWSPPLALIRYLSSLHPSIEFRLDYYEGGGGFQGVYVVKDGQERLNEHCSYMGQRGS